jgi:hypothetical protein
MTRATAAAALTGAALLRAGACTEDPTRDRRHDGKEGAAPATATGMDTGRIPVEF